MKAAPGFAERQLARFKQNYFPSRNPKEVQYDLIKDLKFDSKVCHTVQRVYGLPFTEGIPVQFLFHDLDNDPQTYLETVEADRAQRRSIHAPFWSQISQACRGSHCGRY
jgi:hypothetical protein